MLLPVSFAPKLGRHGLAMKVQQLTLGFSRNQLLSSSSSFSSNTTKHLRPQTLEFMAAPHLESFNSSLVATKFTAVNLHPSLVQSGGTRWNPMPEQIKLLEALYHSGMRTPNPAQIDCIAAELSKYGRIEGKNVFYWFQNHKARERQKQKRSALLALARNTTDAPNSRNETTKEPHDGSCNCKRKCRSWVSVELDVEQPVSGDRTTLELFPLHPESKR